MSNSCGRVLSLVSAITLAQVWIRCSLGAMAGYDQQIYKKHRFCALFGPLASHSKILDLPLIMLEIMSLHFDFLATIFENSNVKNKFCFHLTFLKNIDLLNMTMRP